MRRTARLIFYAAMQAALPNDPLQTKPSPFDIGLTLDSIGTESYFITP